MEYETHRYLIVAIRSTYQTYIVYVDGKRVYETGNRTKAQGVVEYLEQYYGTYATEKV